MFHRILILITFEFLTINSLLSQTIPQVNIPLVVTDGIRSRTLYFGLDPTATNGIDTHLDEMEQPPLPPSGIFDARFVGYDINIPELGEGLLRDYRNGNLYTQGQRMHELRYQVGSGTTITISWDLPSGVTGLLQDFYGGIVINKTMVGKDSQVVTNPGIINKLKITITYNLNGNLPPSAPILLQPVNGATNVSTFPLLKWTIVSGANFYHLQISKDSNFTQIVFNDSTLQSNTIEVQLQSNLKYFWRVRAKNVAGWGPSSSIWNFRTIVEAPPPPTLHSPPKGAIGISVPVEFKWFSVLSAENYTLFVDTTSNFSNPVFSMTLFDTTFIASSLLPGITYYWKVVANNFAGSSSSSEVWNFTTTTVSVNDIEFSPHKFTVYQNYPNPFNSKTIIAYHLANDSFTKFFIYDLQGREIVSNDLGYQNAGQYKLEIDFLSNKFSEDISSGIYFYKIEAGKYSDIKKMIYMK